MVKDYNTPLDEEQHRKIHEVMGRLDSLAEITREATVYRVVNYLMEDKASLERYLTGIAGLVTKRRCQISYRALISDIFHGISRISYYNKDFRVLLTGVVDRLCIH